jgi:hypothetical protein
VYPRQDSSAAPQITQTALPVWGIKNFFSVRLYSAPQSHRTTVLMMRICARAGLNSSVQVRHNQTDQSEKEGPCRHTLSESLQPSSWGR